MAEADARAPAATRPNLRFSYDMLGEGARTDADALQLPGQLPETLSSP
jgi:proline dehydrogenase